MDDAILMNENRCRAITRLSDAETAWKIDDAEVFDRLILSMRPVKEEKLDNYLRGAVVLAFDTSDYPLTDGCIIYFKRPNGELFALQLDAVDTDGTEQLLQFTGALL